MSDEIVVDLVEYYDQRLPHITSTAIAQALKNSVQHFPDLEWLAMAVRRVLALDEPMTDNTPDNRPSNSEVESNLLALAEAASQLANDMRRSLRPYTSECRARYQLFGGEDVETLIGLQRDLKWLSDTSRQAAELVATWKQRGPWRSAQRRQQRIVRGVRLIPVFEEALGREATANKSQPTEFMDFYRRMVRLGFNETTTPDLAAVLQEAIRSRGDWNHHFQYRTLVPALADTRHL